MKDTYPETYWMRFIFNMKNERFFKKNTYNEYGHTLLKDKPFQSKMIIALMEIKVDYLD